MPIKRGVDMLNFLYGFLVGILMCMIIIYTEIIRKD